MIELHLSSEEQKVLRDVLKTSITNLGMEIADTDQKDYRDILKKRKAALSKIEKSLH